LEGRKRRTGAARSRPFVEDHALRTVVPVVPGNHPVDLDSIITSTAELGRRSSRPPDHTAESQALLALAHGLATSPPRIGRGVQRDLQGVAQPHPVAVREAPPESSGPPERERGDHHCRSAAPARGRSPPPRVSRTRQCSIARVCWSGWHVPVWAVTGALSSMYGEVADWWHWRNDA
jgi:hypothetical protein